MDHHKWFIHGPKHIYTRYIIWMNESYQKNKREEVQIQIQIQNNFISYNT